MRLSELIRGQGCAPPRAVAGRDSNLDPDVRGICHDSRRIEPGDLYVAIVGERHDGRDFVPAAIESGAVAVLGPAAGPVSADGADEVSDGVGDVGVPYISVPSPRALLGPLAARLHGHPDRDLTLVGVTGTNGKSTVVALVVAMLEAAARPAGCLGTLGYRFHNARFPELDALGRTTPEASDFFRVLRRFADAGAKAAVMEVSSHALDQGRVAGARFDVAVFTNLTRDHLDYHGDLETYFGAKRRLFDQLADGGRAVVNVDDAYGRRLAARLRDAITFGVADPAGADVYVDDARLDFDGIRASIETPRGRIEVETGLLGRFNLINIVTAIAVAEALEIDHDSVTRALRAQQPVNGRLEPVATGTPFPVLVDFAHTPGALEAALSSLRELAAPDDRRLAVVFGCGGEKDRGKRMPMGQAVATGADFAIATSDNPRGEDPLAILRAVEEGLRIAGGCPYQIEPDRETAIRAAVDHAMADPEGWVLLVAGKGHEATQEIGAETVPFSDHAVLRDALAVAQSSAAQSSAAPPNAAGLREASNG